MRSLKPERQTAATRPATSSGGTVRKLSTWPAKECSAPSSSDAEERTATAGDRAEVVDRLAEFGQHLRARSQEIDGGANGVRAGGVAQGGVLSGRQAGLEGSGDQDEPGRDGQARFASAANARALPPRGACGSASSPWRM